jgi:protein O-GlcNAc transferase
MNAAPMNRAQRRLQQKVAKKQGAPAPGRPAELVAAMQKGMALHQAGRLAEAEAIYRAILRHDPAYPDVNHLLGLIALHFGQHQTALDLITKAITGNPNYAPYHYNRAIALKGLDRIDDGLASLRKALAIDPNHAAAHCEAGVMLGLVGRMDEAIASLDKAIAINPTLAAAHSNRGQVLGQVGRVNESADAYRRAHDLAPTSARLHTNVIFTQDMDMSVSQAEQQAERKRWNDHFIAPLAAAVKPHANSRDPERSLRIGYVSADFNNHSACTGFAQLILDHDRDNFEIHCYDGTLRPDDMSARLREAATGRRRTVGVSDDDMAEMIRSDGIDILLDLSGHTDGHRLLVFGRKPAPVQVTGIGHLAAGLSTIDYRVTSEFFTPRSEETLYPEAPAYLRTPSGFWPSPEMPDVAPIAREAGAGIVFGSLNRLNKISDQVLALWARILLAVPGSRLLMKFHGLDSAGTRDHLLARFAAHDVGEDRLILLGGSSRREHLDVYNRVDIALDPFPQSGGMSTLEAMWMGVSVIGIFSPHKIVTRLCRTLCEPIGVGDWVADSEDGYLHLAVQWAARPEELAAVKASISERARAAYAGFAADVERAYRIMWRRWCAGEGPAPIASDRQA